MSRLLLATAALMALSGCYLGNYEKDQPGPGAQAGYYETTPQSLQMCATLPATGSSGTVTKCPIEAANHMDSLISYVFSDPVNLQYNSTTGAYNFAPNPDAEANTTQFNLPVMSDDNGNLYLPSSPIASFVPMATDHPGCQVTLSVAESGTYSSSGPFNSGVTDLPILGRISLNLTWTYSIANAPGSNDCSYLSNCWNGTGCTTSDQSGVQGLFGNFVQTNILAVTDLSNVQQLQYVVSFQ